MGFVLNEFWHIFASVSIAVLVWQIFGRKYFNALLTGALLAGFFVDIDHAFDFFLSFGWDARWLNFVDKSYYIYSQKMFLLFHAWEYSVFFVIISFIFIIFHLNRKWSAVFLVLGLALCAHLTLDSLSHCIKPRSYSLMYRISVNFELKDLSYDACR